MAVNQSLQLCSPEKENSHTSANLLEQCHFGEESFFILYQIIQQTDHYLSFYLLTSVFGILSHFLVRVLENNDGGQTSYWNAVYLQRFPTIGPKLSHFHTQKFRIIQGFCTCKSTFCQTRQNSSLDNILWFIPGHVKYF